MDDKTTLRRTAKRLGLARKEIKTLRTVIFELRRELEQSQRDHAVANQRYYELERQILHK